MIAMKSFHKVKWVTLLMLILTLTIATFPILATDETRVFDQANLFTLENITSLETTISEIQQLYNIDVAIVTTDNAQGKTSQDYADDFYDEHGFGYGDNFDGVLLLIDMDNREAYISTCGIMIRYLTDARISKMLDHVISYLGDQMYYESANKFLLDIENYLIDGIPSDQYTTSGDFVDTPWTYDHEPFTNKYGEPLSFTNILLSCAVAAVIALVIALIARGIVISIYKHPRHTIPATTPDRSSVHYSERDDHYVTSHTSRVRIQSNTSSGSHHSSGRSSSHRSSSGRSHGGGGRKF